MTIGAISQSVTEVDSLIAGSIAAASDSKVVTEDRNSKSRLEQCK
jgi:hypothetical protein